LLDFIIIVLQNNAYPYQGLPLFKYYAVACVLLPFPLSFGILLFFLVCNLYQPLRLFPAKLYRQDQFIQAQNEVGDFLREQKIQATDGLLSFGHFVVTHVRAGVPEYLDYLYAWQFVQSMDLLNELYPGWENEFREKLQNNPPRFVLVWLDGVKILNIGAISGISGCEYRLLQGFLYDKLLLFERVAEKGAGFSGLVAQDKRAGEQSRLFLQKGAFLAENLKTLSPYLHLRPKIVVVTATELFAELKNLWPEADCISEADFLNREKLAVDTQYLLYTNSNQNNIVEEMAAKKNGAVITKLL
jgi:hypothetical protein